MKRISILGVPVDNCTRRGAVERIEQLLRSGMQHMVATPNPEMILAARKDADFLRILQSASLNIPDGTGVVWAARHQKQTLQERVTGTDVMIDLCSLKHGYRIFLLGAMEGVAQAAKEKLMAMNPNLHIVGTFAGSPNVSDEQAIVEYINRTQAQLLFVAYGAPQQERWIARNLAKMPTVNVAMGVGGALDFIAGAQVRAPVSWQKAGFEWAWRLLHEPQRWRRIWNAVIVFPLTVLFAR